MSQAEPVHTYFSNSNGGPEPSQFFAHMAVRGDYFQGSDDTTRSILTDLKAVNQGQDAVNNTPPGPLATDLLVTRDFSGGGALEVSLAPEFVPQHGQSFSIVKAQTIVNNFDTATLPTAHNGLELTPVVTNQSLRLSVPQKVVLAWGEDLPSSLYEAGTFENPLTISFPFGSEPAFAPKPDEAEAFESYKTSLLEYVSDQFTQSGVSAVEIVAGPPEEGAINVYFIEKLSPTSRVGGVQRQRQRPVQHRGGRGDCDHGARLQPGQSGRSRNGC